MPGNTIQINDSDNMVWYVGDSMIDSLLTWLEENGQKANPKKPEKTKCKMEMLDEWINELVFPGEIQCFIHNLKTLNEVDVNVRNFCIYTSEHKYNIYAIDRPGEDGYLSCGASTRKMRPGEDWVRGNDLPDGPFNKNTWDSIIQAIVKYELVQLSDYTKPGKVIETVEEN